MESFRRFIIGMADWIALLGVILSTVAGAFTGMAFGSAIDLGMRSGSGTFGFLGFLIGGFAGMIWGGVAASLTLALSEIASNTREARTLLRSIAKSEQPSMGERSERMDTSLMDEPPSAPARSGDSLPIEGTQYASEQHKFSHIRRQITQRSIDILRLANGDGWSVDFRESTNSVIVAKLGKGTRYLYSNAWIEKFGIMEGYVDPD